MYEANLSSAPRTALAILVTAIVMTSITYLFPTSGHAHGVVGDRIFLSPIVGNDAFPDNALDFEVRRSNYGFSLVGTIEKQLGNYSSLLITAGWSDVEPKPAATGASDLSIYLRQLALLSVAHEFALTVSPFLVVPTGDRRIADQGYTHLGAEVLLGKGMGDLPDFPPWKYLRPIAIQAEVGYAGRIQGPANSDDFANLEVEYSLRYLDRFVEPVGIRRPLLQLVPYVQFNYSQAFIASRLTTSPDFRLVPGIAYMGNMFEISLAPQIAINGAHASADRVAILGLVEIFYDEIFPRLGWKPF
jgi:hypothetical protein